jgi:calmodulin
VSIYITGTITAEDLRSVLRALGYDPSPDETSDMLKEMGVSSSSTNDGGSVDLNSFVAFMATKVPLAGFEEEIRNAFRLFDKDGDGFITPAELKTVLGRLGENLTDEDVTAMIAEADTDGDGQVYIGIQVEPRFTCTSVYVLLLYELFYF